jgi:hypothetical protein
MSFFPTQKRQWPGFCERKHETKNAEEVQYYYRMVVCNLLNTQIDLPLDTEPIRAGENEVAAAKRIIERLCEHYTRFFDVVVTDAFYMEGPFVNFCVGKGKDVIIVLKDNYPHLRTGSCNAQHQVEQDIFSRINGVGPATPD